MLVYVVQLLGGIALLISTLCMLKKKPAALAPYLVPWLFTASLVSELPLRPVVPETLRMSCTYVLIPELFASLTASGCHSIVTGLCLCLTSSYLLYQGSENFDTQLLSANSAPLIFVALMQIIGVAEMLRRN